MTADPGSSSKRHVLQETSSKWAAILVWVSCAGALLMLVVLGQDQLILRWLPGLFIAASVAYIFLWLPRLAYDDESVTVTNSFRSHDIPFSRAENVSVGRSVKIRTANKTYTSWGAPFTPGARAAGYESSGAMGPATITPWHRSHAGGEARGPVQDPLLRAWTRYRSGGTEKALSAVATSWNMSAIVLVVLCVLVVGVQQVLSPVLGS